MSLSAKIKLIKIESHPRHFVHWHQTHILLAIWSFRSWTIYWNFNFLMLFCKTKTFIFTFLFVWQLTLWITWWRAVFPYRLSRVFKYGLIFSGRIDLKRSLRIETLSSEHNQNRKIYELSQKNKVKIPTWFDSRLANKMEWGHPIQISLRWIPFCIQ